MFDVSITIPNMDHPTPEAAAEAARRFLASEGMVHDLTFEVRGRRTSPMDRRPSTKAVTLQGHEVELPLMLVLSTAHITKATAGLFEMKTDDIPIHHDKGEYGWVIPLKTGVPLPHTIPADLRGVLAYAESLGASWVMLDRDAETIDALPSWNW